MFFRATSFYTFQAKVSFNGLEMPISQGTDNHRINLG
jgi:hypothetical protein